jgi:hypothetical protein
MACVGDVRAEGNRVRSTPAIAGALPSWDEVGTALTPFITATKVTRLVGPNSSRGVYDLAFDRPGANGARNFEIFDQTGGTEVDMTLFPHDDAVDAKAFWSQWSMENSAITALYDPSLSTAKPRDYYFDVPFSHPDVRVSGMCLPSEAMEPDPCSDFFAWFQFCRWTLQIRLSTPDGRDLPLHSPRPAQMIAALADLTYNRLDCGVPDPTDAELGIKRGH